MCFFFFQKGIQLVFVAQFLFTLTVVAQYPFQTNSHLTPHYWKTCISDGDCENEKEFCDMSITYIQHSTGFYHGTCKSHFGALTRDRRRCVDHFDCIDNFSTENESLSFCDITNGSLVGFCAKLHLSPDNLCHVDAHPIKPHMYCEPTHSTPNADLYCDMKSHAIPTKIQGTRIFCGQQRLCCADDVNVMECSNSCTHDFRCAPDGFCHKGKCCKKLNDYAGAPWMTAMFCNDHYFPKRLPFNAFCWMNRVVVLPAKTVPQYVKGDEDIKIPSCISNRDCDTDQICYFEASAIPRCIHYNHSSLAHISRSASFGDEAIIKSPNSMDRITWVEKCTPESKCHREGYICVKLNGTRRCLLDPILATGRFNRNLRIAYTKFFVDVSLNIALACASVTLFIVIAHQVYLGANIVDVTNYLLDF